MISKKKMWLLTSVIIAVNVLVIAGILYFSNRHTAPLDPAGEVSESLDPADEVSEAADVSDDVTDIEDVNIDDLEILRNAPSAESYNNVFFSLLVGKYVAEDGTTFNFGADYSYTGYFDDDNPDVENYSYEIINESESENIVTVYSADKREEIRYFLDLDLEGNVILTIPDTEIKYVLCYDGMAYKGDKPANTDEKDAMEESTKDENSETEE